MKQLKVLNKIYKYNVIIVGLTAVTAFGFILKLQYLPQVQFLIATTLIMFYLLWALTYHYLDKSLRFEIMVEYVLTALLALIVLYGILLF